ncbi:hypothetical protein HanOQP8_Chr16g0607891 [Helianthus annuus]|nr:hypothetical protein HanLR1_Chr16g0611661 [Helianthus annuus]KAJ0644079.1 hypothetical protein HanOQP8_Chr16g0607891 [Helianthus annuus]
MGREAIFASFYLLKFCLLGYGAWVGAWPLGAWLSSRAWGGGAR